MTLTFGSLFSGIGGFDLAFERAGMTPAWQCEIDKAASAVLASHWPDVPRYEDVRLIGKHNLTPVDVICAGFPCQDLSVAGKRAGLAGARSGLFFEMVRITHELRPAFLVWENVPGLLSSNDGRDFAAVLMALDNIGYSGAWTVLDAQWFGVAQRRRRVFGVFARDDIGAGRCAEILSFPARLCGHPPTRGEEREGVADTATPLTASGRGTERAGESRGQDTLIFEPRYARNGRGAPDTIAPPLKAENGQTGKGDGAPVVAYNWQSGGDVRWSFGLPTLQANQTPAVSVRRLTPTECERLQGFPDGYTAGQSDSARYRQLGNAVAVPCVEWLARRLVSVT